MLSVVLIVKDEAPRLRAALASVGSVPEVIVCDTGSSDGTLDVAAGAGARVFETVWTHDFAAARTAAQRHARFQWVMRMDADERLEVATGRADEWIKSAIARAEREEADLIYVRRRYSPTNEHWFPRIFRADRFRWAHPVHEVLLPVAERRRAIAVPGAVFVHRPIPRPRGYAELAARHLAGHPKSPHLRYYLARGLWEAGRLPECVPALRAFLAGPADYRFHRGEAHRMLGVALATIGEEDAERHLIEAALADGGRAEAIVDLVRLLLARGERAAARRWIALAADASPPTELAPWGGWQRPYLLEGPAWDIRTWRAAWRSAA